MHLPSLYTSDVNDAIVSFILEAHLDLYCIPESALDSKLLNFQVAVADALILAVHLSDMKVKLAVRIIKLNMMSQSCQHRNHLR